MVKAEIGLFHRLHELAYYGMKENIPLGAWDYRASHPVEVPLRKVILTYNGDI